MKSLVKWAGGKGQLVEKIRSLLPPSFNRYYEPFLGGGALLFALEPAHPVVNDINPELVNLYRQVREKPLDFMRELAALDRNHEAAPDCRAFFYGARDSFNDHLGSTTPLQAALLVYLNKHCFNGLYRVNAKGRFNVPFNNKKRGDSFSRDNVLEVSRFLQRAEIRQGDFEDSVNGAQKGDFVFFDSPYAPLNPTSFTSYAQEGFALEDHKRLAALFARLGEHGVFCMLTNHNTPLVRELYRDWPMRVVPVARAINSKADGRTGEEVIVTSYPAL